jgi:D-3-phosphoglycerate dehydrogenase / 2-oxoglutarate reductase
MAPTGAIPVTRTVLVTDYAWPSLDIERAILADVDAELMAASTGEPDELTSLAREADAIMTNWKRVPREALGAAEKCLVVARYGVGLDNIPVDYATELGILVANVPDFCLDEVSDHTMALLLACGRRVVDFVELTRNGQWSLEPGRSMVRLRGQTLGLVGYGNIARALVPKAQSFGLEILVYTPRLEPGRQPDGSEAVATLDELLSRSDYVSVHAPATPETQRLIDQHAFATMKPSAFLINTSRGALVDEVALAEALDDGQLAGAALDVLSTEPAPADHPLLHRPDVLVTPHASFYSTTAIAELQEKTANNVAAVFRGEVPATTVNPEVLQRPFARLRR